MSCLFKHCYLCLVLQILLSKLWKVKLNTLNLNNFIISKSDPNHWYFKAFRNILITWTGPEIIKLLSCSTQPSMKFFLLINVKMPTIVGILTFMSGKNSILGLSEPEKCWISWYFHTCEQLNFYAQLSWAWKKFYNLGPRYAFIGSNSFIIILFCLPCKCDQLFKVNIFSKWSKIIPLTADPFSKGFVVLRRKHDVTKVVSHGKMSKKIAEYVHTLKSWQSKRNACSHWQKCFDPLALIKLYSPQIYTYFYT